MNCPKCGAPMANGCCTYCDYKEPMQQGNITPKYSNNANPSNPSFSVSPDNTYREAKSKLTTLLLCIFLGEFGIHYFYTGKIGMGVLYLFTFGLFGIGWIVDIVRICTGSFKDSKGLSLI